MKKTFRYEDNLRFVPEDEAPTRDFYIVDERGQRFETDDPVFMLDVATGEAFEDCDDYPTQLFLLFKMLRNKSLALSMQGVYAPVYDASGLVFDPDFPEAEWENREDPLYLDLFDAQVALMSIVKSGRYRVFEKRPWLTGSERHTGCEGCAFNQVLEDGVPRCMENGNMLISKVTWGISCPYATKAGVVYPDYVEVTAENLADPSYKYQWVAPQQRTDEMEGARRSWTDSKR